jgi:hypothetical protein
VLTNNSMPSLATIGHNSVLTDVSFLSPMMSDFFGSGLSPRKSIGPILRNMPGSLPIYNLPMQQDNCVGTTLDELAPAAILLNAKEPDKQIQRWQATNDTTPGVVTRRFSDKIEPIWNQSWGANDSAPSTARRRSSFEVPQVPNTHQPSEKPFDNTPMAAPRKRSSQEVVPLAALVECISDTIPMPAQRRISSPLPYSHKQLILDDTPDIAPVITAQRRTSSASTISFSHMAPPRQKVVFDDEAAAALTTSDMAPLPARRRTSSEVSLD